MPRPGFLRVAALVALAAVVAAACSSDDGDGAATTTTAAPDYTIRHVPDDYATIQEAVDAADPGDLVLIGEGTYEEAVVVQTENLVIRGVDRNKVILDGRFEDENGFIVFSDGVAVENLTVRNYTANGVFFTGDYDAERILTGYRVSYVTAHNNGDYGVYAFNATKGQFDNSYAGGSPDSGFYVGQCNPCDALITDVVGADSQLGYSGTNSTGVTIVNSEFTNNIIGVVPNSQDGEELAPNAGTTIIGNWIHDNNNPSAPGNNDDFLVGHGTGVVLIGVENNVVERNLIAGNNRFGIVVLPWIGDIFGGSTYEARNNVVRANVFTGDAEGGHMALALLDSSGGTMGNCFEENTHETTLPADLEALAPCEGEPATGFETVDQYIDRFAPGPPYVDYKVVPPPEYNFENMPDAETAPPRPATDVPMDVDLAAIEVPQPRD